MALLHIREIEDADEAVCDVPLLLLPVDAVFRVELAISAVPLEQRPKVAASFNAKAHAGLLCPATVHGRALVCRGRDRRAKFCATAFCCREAPARLANGRPKRAATADRTTVRSW